MIQLAAIAAGGAIGSLLRFAVSHGVHSVLGRAFPYGTMTVNVSGSLLIGFLYIMLTTRLELGTNWRAFLLVGLLGAFTTFSTFSLETLQLIEKGEMIKAAVNVSVNVGFCIGAAWLGVVIGRAV